MRWNVVDLGVGMQVEVRKGGVSSGGVMDNELK